MAAWYPHANDIFLHAVEITAPAERLAYLAQACGSDAALRGQVDALLAAAAHAGSFLEQPAVDRDATADYSLDSVPMDQSDTRATQQTRTVAELGMVIADRYKLLQVIGEGGMGNVFLAEQQQPVKRMIAVKIIKAGMDSKSVLARFEAERQALALMDHPHIAKVFDAGTTGHGQPFFVMELVKGVPLTVFCDERRLSIEERLQLFQHICQAVQHAHQKGIIHRDLKPSNILVEAPDGRPVPKIIDFGLAKAVHSLPLTERSLFTQFGTVLGTPLYMAPEQAEFNSMDVDTRADIYALGVILYELLTGTTPVQKQRLETATWDEIRRVIKEDEPPTPSARLSTTEALPSIAARRQTEPHKLGKYLRGDLDWVVMKALAKERSRRYETANAFAADVARFLNHEPVAAGPPTVGYKLRKFVRRHRGPVIAVALVALVLVGGIIGTTWGMVRAEAAQQRESERADGERHAKEIAEKRLDQIEKGIDLLASIFRDLNPRTMEREDKTLQELLGQRLDRATQELRTDAIGDPRIVAKLQLTLGVTQVALGYPEKAIPLLKQAQATFAATRGDRHPETLLSLHNLAAAYQEAKKYDEALPLLEESFQLRKTVLGPMHPDTLTSSNNLAVAYLEAGQVARALSHYENVVAWLNDTLGPHHPLTLTSMNYLAAAYLDAGQLGRALPLAQQSLQANKTTLGLKHPDTLLSMSTLAMAYQTSGKLTLALPLFEETLDVRRATLGSAHPDTLTSMNLLGRAYLEAGNLAQALPIFDQTLRLCRSTLGATHPQTLASMNNLAAAYKAAGKLDEALPLLEETLRTRRAKLGATHPDTLTSMNNLAATCQAAGKLDLAIPLYEETLNHRKKLLGPTHPHTLTSMNNLAGAYAAIGDHSRASRLYLELLPLQRQSLPPEHPRLISTLTMLGQNLMHARQFAAAEPVLRECLAIREKTQPDDWTTFNIRSMLGGALLGQKKYAEAEPLLLKGCEGMKQRVKTIPPPGKIRLIGALERLVQLYEATGKSEEVAKWRKELEAVKATQQKPEQKP